MVIIGLENNYYLSLNDIWIAVNSFSSKTNALIFTVTNLTSGKSLLPLNLSPSPNDDYEFNICIPVRSLFPYTDHVNVNSLQQFKFDFRIKFEDTTIPDQVVSLEKYFVRGGREKNGKSEWFLSNTEELIIGKWIEWNGISLPGFAQRIVNNKIVSYVPGNEKIFTHNLNNSCDYKILKFLNSIGGYQYFVFEKFLQKNKTKSGKTIPKKTRKLKYDNFRNTSINNERTIELKTFTPLEIQDVFTELVNSPEVFLYNPEGDDNYSRWELLKLESNDSEENNYDRKYENKIEFSRSNYFKRTV